MIRYHWRAEATRSVARRDRILDYWTRVHEHSRRRLAAARAAPWLHGSWHTDALCVHSGYRNGVRVGSGEGAWDSNTGNGYYGGLQFDLSTWRSNGGTGRPDLASPAEQLRVAYRAWQARGWSPWPNTAAACGLL